MKLAEIQVINEILPIEGADRIQLAKVLSWGVVIKKDQFKVGDRIVFIYIDTLLRPAVWNEFLHDKNDPTKLIRIRNARIRGQASQGLIFPLDILEPFVDYEIGQDVSEQIGVTKFIKQISLQLQGIAKGDFPTHLISKTDEDNLLSNPQVLEELKECDQIQVRGKQDGMSVSYIKENDGTFRVCSRNLELEDGDNLPWKMARKYNLSECMLNGTALQVELCGPSVNGNLLKLEEPELFCFNYKDLNKNEYLPIHYLPNPELKPVPFVALFQGEEIQNLTIDSLQKLANEQTYGKDPAEGIVIRGYKDGKLTYSKILQKMLSVKIINQNYKD